jgi:hypothetical protein
LGETASPFADHVALDYFTAGELERLVQQACSAAEKSPGRRAGEEFIYYLEEEPSVLRGIELSAFVVCHRGTSYEVFYYDGLLAQMLQ